MKTKNFKLFWGITMISQVLTLLVLSIATNWLDSASYYGGWMLCYITIPSVVLMFITQTVAKVNNRWLFTIKKGKHYVFHFPKLYFGIKKKFEIRIKLDKDCLYDFGNIDNLDVNKLWGISFGYHHNNSIRIGYSKNKEINSDDFNLYLYYYENKIRNIKYLTSFNALEELLLSLKFSNGGVDIRKDEVLINCTSFNPKIKIGYYLFPYFGGNNVAPHDMTFELEVK